MNARRATALFGIALSLILAAISPAIAQAAPQTIDLPSEACTGRTSDEKAACARMLKDAGAAYSVEVLVSGINFTPGAEGFSEAGILSFASTGYVMDTLGAGALYTTAAALAGAAALLLWVQQHTLRASPALLMRRRIRWGGVIALVAVLVSALPLAAREDNHPAERSLPRDDSSIAAQVNDIPAGLETLPADRLTRLATLRQAPHSLRSGTSQGRLWLERGIRFEGATWDAHTVGLAMTGLDTLLRRFDGDWDKLKPLLGLKANASLVYDDDTSKCPSGRRANCALPWKGRIHFNVSSLTLQEFLHENGHVVDWFLQKERGTSGDWWSTTGLLGLGWTLRSGEAMYDDAERDAPYSQASMQEDFADSFVAWVLGPEPPEPYRELSPRRHRALNVAFKVFPE